MPKCQTWTNQPFSQAPTASADDRSKAISISEVWPLNQGIALSQKYFKFVYNHSSYGTKCRNVKL
jgi:hypothetical protein